MLKYLPDMLTGLPCVRCPPWLRFMPSIGVARLQQREVYRKVGLCARVRLYIGMIRAEQLARALACQIFHYVHVLAAAIVALARIALGILVG